MERKYEQIVRFVQETPWAVKPEMLLTIRGIVAARLAGVELEPVAAKKPVPNQGQGSVAVLPLWGVILPHASMMTNISGGVSLDSWIEDFRGLVNDPQISSIILDVDSPGGAVAMVPEAAAEIRAATAKKRVVAVANTEIASAAYWLASQAEEIVMPASGQVGSVGVIAEHVDESQLEEMAGISRTFVTAGEYKAEQLGPLSEEAKAAIQSKVDQMYEMFTGDVAKGRGVSQSVVKNTYGKGRMLTARDALAAGMVDRIGTLDQVIARELPGGRRRTTSAVDQDVEVAATDDSNTVVVFNNTGGGGGQQVLPVFGGQLAATSGTVEVTFTAGGTTVTRIVGDQTGGVSVTAEGEEVDLAAGAIPAHSTPVVDEPWDAGAVEKALPTDNQRGWKSVYAWYDGSGADEDGDGLPDAKADWKFPHHTKVGGPANINGVNNAKARLANSNIPASDKAGVEAHLQRHQDDWHKKGNGSASRGASTNEEGMMDERQTLEQLAARRDEIRARMRELHNEAQGRRFYEEEQNEFDELENELGDTVSAMDNIKEREARLAAAGGAQAVSGDGATEVVQPTRRRTTSSPSRGRVFTNAGVRLPENIYDLTAYRGFGSSIDEIRGLYREGAMRVLDIAPFETADPDKTRAHAEKLLGRDKDGSFATRMLTAGSPLYDRAFGKLMMSKPLNSQEDAALKAAVSNTGLGSETPVPVTIDPTVILTSDGTINPLRQLARNVTITGTKWQGISSDGMDVAYEAELTQVADQTPTFDAPTAEVVKAHAYVEFSIEVDQDWGELRSNLATFFQDAKDMKEANKFLFGTGTNEPEGLIYALVNDGNSIVYTATLNTFAVEDLYTVKGALPPRFRSNASWLANDDVFSAVRQFDEAGGSALWAQLGADRPPVLIGKPVYEASEMSGEISTGNEEIIVYGDFQRGFIIVDRVGMNVELIPHVLGSNRRPIGARALYAYFRNTSALLTANAFRVLTVKPT